MGLNPCGLLMFVNDFSLKAKMDTGAQVNILNRSVYDKLGSNGVLRPAWVSSSRALRNQ